MAVTNVNPQYQQSTVDRDFVAAQKARTVSGKLNNTKYKFDRQINERDRQNTQNFKQTAGGQVIRNTVATGTRSLRRTRNKSNNKIVRKAAGYAATKVKVSAANTWITAWAMFWYLTFQLPIAVISAAGIGMAASVYEKFGEATFSDGAFSFVVNKLFTFTANTAPEVISFIADKFFGIDFDPISLFILPFALIFLLGLFQLILTWFVYSAIGIKSLSGNQGGLKGATFILVGIGYAIPILNLFPLIFLWMAIVWKYPK